MLNVSSPDTRYILASEGCCGKRFSSHVKKHGTEVNGKLKGLDRWELVGIEAPALVKLGCASSLLFYSSRGKVRPSNPSCNRP